MKSEMKKLMSLFALLLVLLALTGCAKDKTPSGPYADPEPDVETPEASTGISQTEEWDGKPEPESPMATMTCRVIQVSDSGLTLAKLDGGYGDVYDMAYGSANVEGDPQVGSVVTVTYEYLMESYPAQLGTVTDVVTEDGFDDLCALYMGAIEDMWDTDSALNADIEYLGIDLSETSLSKAEQGAIAWILSGKYGLEPVQGTFDELAEHGYIDKENLYWEDGCLFIIRETEKTDKSVTFDLEKWRSGLGAIFYDDCQSKRDSDGHWKEYSTGSMAIA